MFLVFFVAKSRDGNLLYLDLHGMSVDFVQSVLQWLIGSGRALAGCFWTLHRVEGTVSFYVAFSACVMVGMWKQALTSLGTMDNFSVEGDTSSYTYGHRCL